MSKTDVGKPNICLMMIVKNEAATLPNLLPSVEPLISSWLIIDTGSSDATKEVVHKHLSSVPGEFLEREWKSFGANRSELISLIPESADYALLLDADHVVNCAVPENFYSEIQNNTESDSFLISVRDSNLEYLMPYLVRTGPEYFYVGSTHEYLTAKQKLNKSKPLASFWLTHMGNGGSKADKFERDRKLLEGDILRGESNSRNHFYLAQTYEHLELTDLSLEHYSISANLSSWDEEKYISHLRSGRIHSKAGRTELALESFGLAYECCPDRSEALYEIVKVLESRGLYSLAHRILKAPDFAPKDRALFLESWIVNWGLDIEAGVVAWRVGHKTEAKEIFEKVLNRKDLPDATIALVKKNLEFC